MDKEAFIKLCESNEWKEWISFVKKFRNDVLEKIATNTDVNMFEKTCTPFHILQGQIQLIDDLIGEASEFYKKIDLEYRTQKAMEATRGKA